MSVQQQAPQPAPVNAGSPSYPIASLYRLFENLKNN